MNGSPAFSNLIVRVGSAEDGAEDQVELAPRAKESAPLVSSWVLLRRSCAASISSHATPSCSCQSGAGILALILHHQPRHNWRPRLHSSFPTHSFFFRSSSSAFFLALSSRSV